MKPLSPSRRQALLALRRVECAQAAEKMLHIKSEISFRTAEIEGLRAWKAQMIAALDKELVTTHLSRELLNSVFADRRRKTSLLSEKTLKERRLNEEVAELEVQLSAAETEVLRARKSLSILESETE